MATAVLDRTTVTTLPPGSRVSSLDGLRAVSIVLVLLGHLNGTKGFVKFDLGVGDYAHLGVVVFFVISGFLITGLLIAERERYGSVSLRLFYARRALRIFPASYAYLACVAALSAFRMVHLRGHDLFNAFSYTVNYFPSRSWVIGHLWSLSVEEQFYLLWPFAVVSLGLSRSRWVAASVIAVGPLARALAWLFLRGTPYRDLEMFPMVADALAAGCLLAHLRGWLETQRWYLALFRPSWSIFLLALVLLLNREMNHTVVGVFGTAVVNLCLAVLVHRSVCRRDPLWRFLNWSPVAFVGTLSYSLYLWQQPFLDRHSTQWVCAFPQNLTLAFGVALASYFLLERPLMKLRSRLRH